MKQSPDLLKFNEAPEFDVIEFRRKQTKHCFAPVVYDEGYRFREQIRRMAANAELADILVCERRSTDGSTEPSFLREHGVRALLSTDAAGGATAIRMAVKYGLEQGYDGFVLVDGHGKDGVEALPRFLEQLEAGKDFVQGSRFMKGGIEKNTPLSRVAGIRFIMAPLLWWGSGFWYTDGTNGFRGYSRCLLTHPEVEPLRSCFTHFNLQYYLSYIAPKLGLNVIEIPVSRVYPDDGTVPTKVVGLRRNFEAFWEMVRTVTGKYDVAKDYQLLRSPRTL